MVCARRHQDLFLFLVCSFLDFFIWNSPESIVLSFIHLVDELNAQLFSIDELRRLRSDSASGLTSLLLLYSWGFEGVASGGYYGSSSPEGVSSPPPTTEPPPTTAPPQAKTIAMERNRRKKLDDKLYALRSIVPKITKVIA